MHLLSLLKHIMNKTIDDRQQKYNVFIIVYFFKKMNLDSRICQKV